MSAKGSKAKPKKFPDDIKDIQEVQHQITIDKLIEDRLFF